MKYKNIEYLNHLPNSKKPGLNNILKVLSFIGNPHLKLTKNIIITGTNGKGTVAKTLNKIYTDSSYSVGLYTSPHLIRISERIRVKDKDIRLDVLNKLLGELIGVSKKTGTTLSFFELLTATAIYYFSKRNNDINIFEVGLGGKYDATNIIKSKIGVITNVEMDHMEYLGNTLDKIAYEKVGIVNKNSKLITTVNRKTIRLIDNYCKKNNAQIYKKNSDFKILKNNEFYIYKSDENNFKFKTKLIGFHQLDNIGASLKTLEVANKLYNLKISKRDLIKSLMNVSIPARFEIISKEPILIVDVAHNFHSIKTLVRNFKNIWKKKKVNIVMGMLKEKKPIDCIKELSKIANHIYLTDVPNPRTSDPKKIIDNIKSNKISVIENDDIESLIKKQEDLIITGSIYLIGSIISRKYVKIK